MDETRLKDLKTIREKWMSRMDEACVNEDGSASSGNWGHVGRPGIRGGSMPGGGSAFRLRQTSSKKKSPFTSQAQIRDELKKAYKEAKEKGRSSTVQRLEKRMSRVNMNVKSANKKNIGRKGYQVVNKIDRSASKNILRDKKRGKKSRESTVMKATGTKEAVQYTFPERTTRGGSGTRGGKTKKRTSKV